MGRTLLGLIARVLPTEIRDAALGDLAEDWTRHRHRSLPLAVWHASIDATSLVLSGCRWRLQRRSISEGRRLMIQTFRDARFAIRLARRDPWSTVVVVLTLALGLGATSALFAVTNAWLLRPLPFPGAERLTVVWETIPSASIFENTPAPASLFAWQAGAPAFESLGAFTVGTSNLTGDGEPEQLATLRATADLLKALEVRPVAGRLFSAEEGQGAGGGVALVTEGFWRRRFGSRPAVVGRTVTLDGQPTAIVGILPASAQLLGLDVDIWRPLVFSAEQRTDENHYLWVIGRLREGATVGQANDQVDSIAKTRSRGNTGARAATLQSETVGSLSRDLPVLLGATAVLLLIAGANVAGMTLARASTRRDEFVVRAALGAGQGRLVRQVLVEGLVLGLAAGAVGWLLCQWLLRVLEALMPQAATLTAVDPFDPRVFAFVAGAAIAISVLAGLAPALRSASTDLMTEIRAGARSIVRGRWLFLRGLAALEMALALALLIAATLVARSYIGLSRVDLGFRPEHVVTFELPRKATEATAFQDRLLDALRGAPGLSSAALTQALPLKSFGFGSGFLPEGGREPGSVLANWRIVSPEYFTTLSLPLRAGRPFDRQDRDGAARVAIVSESFARRAWPDGRSPIGRRIGWVSLEHPMLVVGVASDIRLSPSAAPVPHVYMPFTQVSDFVPTQLAVQSTLPTARVVDEVRRTVWQIDPLQPIANVRSMDDLLWRLMGRRRFQLILWTSFAGLAAVLSMVGVYGILSYVVRQARRELGIRLALGASPRSVSWLVVRQGLTLTAAGLAGGAVLAYWSAAMVSGFLFGVDARDAATYAAAAGALAVVGLLACAIPARRAAAIDPIRAIRLE